MVLVVLPRQICLIRVPFYQKPVLHMDLKTVSCSSVFSEILKKKPLFQQINVSISQTKLGVLAGYLHDPRTAQETNWLRLFLAWSFAQPTIMVNSGVWLNQDD